MSVMNDCFTGSDGLYDPLLLGAVNDTGELAASAMDFAPGMWLNPLLDSGNGVGAVIPESVFATADVDCSEFLHIVKIQDPPMSFADVERSQYQNVWNDSDYAEFSGLWNSNAFGRLKEWELRGSTIGEGGDTTISSPGRSPKQSLPGMRLHDPLHGRQACPEFIAFDQGVGQICPR